MKPHYRVKVLNKQTNAKGEIGAAWINTDKSITIVLDNFIRIVQDGNLLITLFPIES